MEANEIKTILMKELVLEEVHVIGEDRHFQIIAVSEQFSGMNRVKKQQMIYVPLMKYLLNDYIHALSIKVYTPDEWQRDRKLNGL